MWRFYSFPLRFVLGFHACACHFSWGICLVQVSLFASCRWSSGWWEPKARVSEQLTLCMTKETCGTARWVTHLQEPRTWEEEQLWTEGIKAQGFLCWGSSWEAASWAVSLFLHMNKLFYGTGTLYTLLWETWSDCVRGGQGVQWGPLGSLWRGFWVPAG